MTVIAEPERETNHNSIALPTVSKQNWKSADIRDRWEADGITPGFCPIRETYELATLREDHPRMGYIIPNSANVSVDEIVEMNEKGLTLLEIVREGEVDSLAVGIDETSAEQIRSAVLADSYSQLEKLFGVPKCCRRFAEEHRNCDLHDPVYEAACNSPSAVEHDGPETVRVENPKPILNVMWSYLGWQFIDFHPCSFECEAAFDVAVKNGKLMREVDPDGDLDALYEMLTQPASWSGYHGLTHVKNSHCIGSYDCDDRWDERKVIWIEEHSAKAGGCS